jgi:hypothetical protein
VSFLRRERWRLLFAVPRRQGHRHPLLLLLLLLLPSILLLIMLLLLLAL